MQLSEYFEHTFVISLPERSDRRSQVAEELESIGMPLQPGKVEFFDAIRGEDPGGFPCAGAHGCFRSHLGAIERAIERDLNSVLILEDDVAFLPPLRALQPTITRTLAEIPWDLAFLGHCNPVTGSEYTLEPTTDPVRGAHCYGVHRRSMVDLRDFLRSVLTRPPGHPAGGPMHYDGALYTFHRFAPERIFLMSRPSLALQSASRSDIAGGRWFDDVPALTGAVSLMRRLKTRWRQQFRRTHLPIPLT